MSNLTKWKVKFGNNLQFVRFFNSREDAVIFAIGINGAIYSPLYEELP